MTVEQNSHEQSGKTDQNRRRFIKRSVTTFALGSLASFSTKDAIAQTSDAFQVNKQPFAQDYKPAPLSFDPAKLNGLSARLIESHWSNNYGGSVKALNETNKRLSAALADPELPAFTYNDLKREHLMRVGSVVLHELYFENLGGGGETDAQIRTSISFAFGSFDRWETEFRRIAMGLGGGAGWVMLGYNRHLQCLENYWMADHMHSPAATTPLLVMDMYEHSYQMDYGAATARYVDAFFNNINWQSVARRIEAI
jgi:Fe-Mn family superoxide dismutase